MRRVVIKVVISVELLKEDICGNLIILFSYYFTLCYGLHTAGLP